MASFANFGFGGGQQQQEEQSVTINADGYPVGPTVVELGAQDQIFCATGMGFLSGTI